MQQDEFNPSSGGWLGSIIHDRPYYDFSGKYPFEQKIRELLSCIEAHLHKQNQAETFKEKTQKTHKQCINTVV